MAPEVHSATVVSRIERDSASKCMLCFMPSSRHAGSHFGAVVEDVLPVVYKIGEQVKAVFQSACPRNNVRLEGTFLTVERQDEEDSDKWELVSCCALLMLS